MTRLLGLKQDENIFNLLLDESFMTAVSFGFADFLQMMAIETEEKRQDARGRYRGCSEVSFGDSGAFELVFVRLVLSSS